MFLLQALDRESPTHTPAWGCAPSCDSQSQSWALHLWPLPPVCDLCGAVCRLTSNISELGAYGHLEVLKDPATLAHLHKVIQEISTIRETLHTTPSDEARPAAVATAAAAASDFTPSWPTGGGGNIVPQLRILSKDHICIPIPKMSKITQAIQKVFSRGARRLFAYGMDAPSHNSMPAETSAGVSGQDDTTSGKLQTK